MRGKEEKRKRGKEEEREKKKESYYKEVVACELLFILGENVGRYRFRYTSLSRE